VSGDKPVTVDLTGAHLVIIRHPNSDPEMLREFTESLKGLEEGDGPKFIILPADWEYTVVSSPKVSVEPKNAD
jgi:hypothetical protein